MRKNGFTLIELLAVIVILAIIALIATPIILGIINDAREKANERSVELYASAVRNGIAAYQLREMKEVAAGAYTSETLPFDVEYDGDVKCTTIELHEDGGVSLEGCKVNGGEKEYSYGTTSIVGTMGICNPLDIQIEGKYTAGDKYECDVDPNKEGYDYTFYVLTSATSGSVNLIMDSNINISGEAVKEGISDLGKIAWYADAEDNSYGPITAMNYLKTATAGWINVNSHTIDTFSECNWETGICVDKSMKQYVVNARMPYYSEISDYDGNNAYLYDNLDAECFDEEWSDYVSCDVSTNIIGVHEEGMTHVSGVGGYWILSSYVSDSSGAWYVDYNGDTSEYGVSIDDYSGVRPVINLSI